MDDMEYDDAGHHDIEDEEVPEEEEEIEEELYDNGDDGSAEDTKVQILDESHKQPNAYRITTRYMTKYERARVLGTRALQIRFVFFFSSRVCMCFLFSWMWNSPLVCVVCLLPKV